jgi:hypothetical protein
MPGIVLGDVASWRRLYLAAKPSHVRGRGCQCGRASLSSAPSYDLQSLVEGTMLHVRHCLVPSCSSERWHLSKGCEAPELGYLMECWPTGYLCYRILHGVNYFLSKRIYPMSESSWHLCVYP